VSVALCSKSVNAVTGSMNRRGCSAARSNIDGVSTVPPSVSSVQPPLRRPVAGRGWALGTRTATRSPHPLAPAPPRVHTWSATTVCGLIPLRAGPSSLVC
jgi:hypothetical protein